jgi:opacity protein-like surface antigen
MKKIVMLIALSAFLLSAETPQKSDILNIFGAVGIGFKTGGELFVSTERNTVGEITKETDSYLNYGQGFKIDVGTQYFTMPNLAIQAAFSVSFGIPGFETEDKIASVFDSTTKYSRDLFGIKLQVVPHFEVLELLNMYTGVGLGFFWNRLHYQATVVRPVLGTTTEKGKIISSPSMGFTGMLGADYPISDAVSAFAELAFEQVSFKWKKKVVDGTNKTTFFEEDAPNTQPPPKVPGSNWQVRIGIRLGVL